MNMTAPFHNNLRQPYSSLMDDKKYRIAYFDEALDHPSLDPEISGSIKGLLENLKTQGHQVQPVSFDFLDHIVPAYYVLPPPRPHPIFPGMTE